MTAEARNGSVHPLGRRVRVHQLAQRLGVPPADVLHRAQQMDLDVRSVLQSVDEPQIRRIVEAYKETAPGENGAVPRHEVLDEILTEIEQTPRILTPEKRRLRTIPLSDWGRRVAMVGLAIMAATVVVAVLVSMIFPVRAAESEVVVTGISSDADRELESFNTIASSHSVLSPVAEALDVSVSDLMDAFTTEVVGDSTVIRFIVTDPSAERAQAINDAIVESFLAVANQTIDQGQVEFIDNRITEVQDRLDEIGDRLGALDAELATDEATRVRIETDMAVAQNQLDSLESRLIDLRTGEAPGGSVSFVQSQIEETNAALDALVAELQTLQTPEKISARAEAEALRDERNILFQELAQLQQRKVEQRLEQIGQARARVLAPAYVVEGSVGLTPVRAVALGVLVGGLLAFAWIIGATQLRRRR